MDCVRVSIDLDKELRLKGKYKEVWEINWEEGCRDRCISDLDCTGWYYLDSHKFEQPPGKTYYHPKKGVCYLTDTDSQDLEFSLHSNGGKIKCKNLPKYGYILMWLGISAVVLFVVWYFLNVFEPKKYNLHEKLFFNNLHFKSASEF